MGHDEEWRCDQTRQWGRSAVTPIKQFLENDWSTCQPVMGWWVNVGRANLDKAYDERKRQEKNGKGRNGISECRKKLRHQNSWKQSERLRVWVQEEGGWQRAAGAGSKSGGLGRKGREEMGPGTLRFNSQLCPLLYELGGKLLNLCPSESSERRKTLQKHSYSKYDVFLKSSFLLMI